MKKSIIMFILAGLVIFLTISWAVNIKASLPEAAMIVIVFIIAGFAVYVGVMRILSTKRNEPPEDELSKKIMTKASSIAFYISLYFWLFLMFMSDGIGAPPDTLIGAGMAGMAIIFLLSWLGIKLFGLNHD